MRNKVCLGERRVGGEGSFWNAITCRMSVVSSVLSTRSSPWNIPPRLASLMDSIFAIGFGLGLRFVVDAVSHHDFKLTGTLVGLWEGIILLHFLKKMPKSTDPYVAYAVRLFVDFLCTESVARLVLVLIWTGMGMVLADITPALWDDVGLNRIWRRFRRDIYTISRMIPTVAFFPPPRTVRFSPSRAPSIIPDEPSILDSQPPSIVTTIQTATTPNTVPATTTSTAPAAREVLRRRVPGYFPADYSDTDTDLGSIRAGPSMGRTSRRLSVYPQAPDYDDSVTDLSSANDLDDANLSSGASSASTERADPSSITFDTAVIPDMEEEEEEQQQQLLVDTAAVPAKDAGERTPRQAASMYLPPTPSDSAVRWRPKLEPDEPLPVRPFSSLPQIPDFLEEPTTEDLEKIQPTVEKPPTPPAKDDLPTRFVIPPVPQNPPPEPLRGTPSPEDDWEMLAAFSVPEATTSTHANRQSLPPAYRESEEFDDIYGEEYSKPPLPPPPPTAANPFTNAGVHDKGKGVDLGAQTSLIDDSIASPLGAPFNLNFGANAAAHPWDPRAPSAAALANPWSPPATSGAATGLFDAARPKDEEKERLKLEAAAMAEAARQKEEEEERIAAEAAAAKQKEEERIALEVAAAAAVAKAAEEAVERKRKEDEAAAEQERLKEEELKKQKEEEKAERKRKEEADERARQLKRAEEEAAERKRAEEDKAARKAEEKRIKEEEKQKKLEEKARKAEEKRKEEEALAAKKAEEAEAAKIAKEQRRKDAEEAAARREKASLEKEEKEKQERETAEAAAREAEEKRKQEDELAKVKADGEAAEATAAAVVAIALGNELQEKEEQKTKEEADKLKEAQAEAQQQQEETPAATTGGVDPTSSPDAQQAHEPTPKYKQRDLPPTPSSPEPTNGQLADATITPEDPAQADESGESPAQGDDLESVATEASEMPSKVGDRLERLLLGKAQMIDVRDRIQELKQKLEDPEQDRPSIAEQLKVSEKILKKMERKEQRRYNEGASLWYQISGLCHINQWLQEWLNIDTKRTTMQKPTISCSITCPPIWPV